VKLVSSETRRYDMGRIRYAISVILSADKYICFFFYFLWKNCAHFSPISSARNREMAVADTVLDNEKNIKRVQVGSHEKSS
jgi:hypothetical protein